MSGKGSGGNVLAALCSFFIPGLGQLLQGRLLASIFYFIFAFVAWFFLVGWIIHLISVIDAAIYSPKNRKGNQNIAIKTESTKKCPYCAEIIKSEAILCRFCGKELPPQSTETINQQNNRTRLSTRQCYLCNKRFPEEDLKEIGGEIFCSTCEVKINPDLLRTIES